MSKAPAFQFYPAEYLADGKVKLMDFRQKGIYMDLLCHCWLEGSIPTDQDLLARMLGIDAAAFANDWKWIEPCFRISKKDATKMIHPRLEAEREKQKSFSGKQSERAKKRWGKEMPDHATALPDECHGSTEHGNALHLQSSSSSSEKRKSPPKISFSEADMSIAKFIENKIRLALDHSFKAKNIEVWANEIRLMSQQDGRSHESIKELYSWVNSDPFWRKQVLSPAKLREKWVHLSIQKNNPPIPKNTAIPGNRIVPAEDRTAGVLKF